MRIASALVAAVLAGGVSAAWADDQPQVDATAEASQPGDWAVHGQATVTEQYHPGFHAPYTGQQSMDRGRRGDETTDETLFLGYRPWDGGEIWINPEIDQGFGISNTYGAAGYPSAEAYKLGKRDPYILIHRAFLRQTIDLGGEASKIDEATNQFALNSTENRIVLTLGMFSLADVFDNNKYAHDPRGDFLNWSVVDGGWFDYAADAWGYTYGAAAEWYQGDWALRGGIGATPHIAGNLYLEPVPFSQFQVLGEIEHRHEFGGHPGVVRFTSFLTRERLGSWDAAAALAQATGQPADASLVRRYMSKTGYGINVEQEVTKSLGVFVRAGTNSGNAETTSFTDISQSVSAGVSITGDDWNRPDDTLGAVAVWNQASRQMRNYLAHGGIALLIGDGQLTQSAAEHIVETYYDYVIRKNVELTFDYQFIQNPAYNRQRGPLNVFGTRLHVEF